MTYEKHLYLILYPSRALVASQLTPEQFAKHYQIGSSKHYVGKVIFAEVDINYRHKFFNIGEVLEGLVPHSDGRPKATKYICSYRVLEHIDYDAIRDLFLVNTSGKTLKLTQKEYDKEHQPGFCRTFAQINPLTMLALTTYTPEEYGKYITAKDHSIGAPKLFFTQIELPTDEFLRDFEENSFVSPPFAFIHPAKLRDAILEVENSNGKKPIKGVSLRSDLECISYNKIRHGFWFASATKSLFYPMPSMAEIERDNYDFYRTMS